MGRPANHTDTAPASCDGQGRRIAVVFARFNDTITEPRRDGAVARLRAAGVEDIDVIEVPGAFELPLACLMAAKSGRFDAVVALGAVIRGGTDHYEHVCTQTSRGVLEVQLQTGMPIGFGLLTCTDIDQALARAGGAAGNKGADAAEAALLMLAVQDHLA
jgi:6,7-dimethyl-8-ribityllumazine synthase